jgi:hypothetical protein
MVKKQVIQKLQYFRTMYSFIIYVRSMKIIRLIYLAIFLISCSACHNPESKISTSPQAVADVTFKKVYGISYTEVRRTFNSPSGYIFDKQGYQLTPEWRITFLANDSVNIYSPKLKKFINCPVLHDHADVFNIAWAWVKVYQVSKDSLTMRVLDVESKAIIGERSNTFMKFYSNDYIKNALRTTPQALMRPKQKDTLFIKAKAEQARVHPDSAFAAYQPVELKALSPLVSVTKNKAPVDSITRNNNNDEYMEPEYTIAIKRAYADFYHSFYVFVDAKGALTFRTAASTLSPGYEQEQIATMKAITAGYLAHYLKATPGRTLGIPHTSFILLHVQGSKG